MTTGASRDPKKNQCSANRFARIDRTAEPLDFEQNLKPTQFLDAASPFCAGINRPLAA
jgi:hypothetical protein